MSERADRRGWLMGNFSQMLAGMACVAALAVSGCAVKPTQITILATNDIHRSIEPNLLKDGTIEGGLAAFSGTVKAIKAGLKRKLGDQAGVLVVDAGDQFQGALISNYNEGRLVLRAMSQVGYDVAITGNHDYDFGPVGWLEDEVTPTTVDKDPRGALKAALAYARFPLVSANTFLRSSPACQTPARGFDLPIARRLATFAGLCSLVDFVFVGLPRPAARATKGCDLVVQSDRKTASKY